MPNEIMNATIVEMAIVPHATTPLNVSFFSLPPISQLITAPASGANMMMLRRLFSTIYLLTPAIEPDKTIASWSQAVSLRAASFWE